MIHRGGIRLTIALPFSHGLSKSEFGLPCGFGACSHSRAIFIVNIEVAGFLRAAERDVEIGCERDAPVVTSA